MSNEQTRARHRVMLTFCMKCGFAVIPLAYWLISLPTGEADEINSRV